MNKIGSQLTKNIVLSLTSQSKDGIILDDEKISFTEIRSLQIQVNHARRLTKLLTILANLLKNDDLLEGVDYRSQLLEEILSTNSFLTLDSTWPRESKDLDHIIDITKQWINDFNEVRGQVMQLVSQETNFDNNTYLVWLKKNLDSLEKKRKELN